MPNRISRATASRLGLLAFDVLEQAYRRASNGPIEPSAVEKLALGYLVVSGLTSPEHVKVIWQMLQHESTFQQPSCREAYYGPVLYEIKLRAKALASPPKS